MRWLAVVFGGVLAIALFGAHRELIAFPIVLDTGVRGTLTWLNQYGGAWLAVGAVPVALFLSAGIARLAASSPAGDGSLRNLVKSLAVLFVLALALVTPVWTWWHFAVPGLPAPGHIWYTL
jgi:hypothetical protein